jgi:hypothetical protein
MLAVRTKRGLGQREALNQLAAGANAKPLGLFTIAVMATVTRTLLLGEREAIITPSIPARYRLKFV